MGTRGLTIVKIDGNRKIGQYGQWDHNLDGQGKTVLEFICNDMKPRIFRKAIRECKFLTDAQVDGTSSRIQP